jgi:hypothetical protein
MRAWPSSASAATAVSQSRTGWLSCRRPRVVPNGCSARCTRSWLTASRSPTARSRAADRRRHRHRAPPASARTQTKDADDRSHCVLQGSAPARSRSRCAQPQAGIRRALGINGIRALGPVGARACFGDRAIARSVRKLASGAAERSRSDGRTLGLPRGCSARESVAVPGCGQGASVSA